MTMTAERETALIAQAQAGDDVAMTALLADQESYLQAEVRRRTQDPSVAEDLLQEGRIAVLQAVRRFDPSHGGRLWTYAKAPIRKALNEALTASASLVAVPAETARIARSEEGDGLTPSALAAARTALAPPVTLDAPIAQDTVGGLTWEEVLPDRRLDVEDRAVDRAYVEGLLDTLAPRSRMVLELAYGFGEEAPQTEAQIADRLGLSPRSVRRVKTAALARLRAVSA